VTSLAPARTTSTGVQVPPPTRVLKGRLRRGARGPLDASPVSSDPELRPIGHVESPLTERASAPHQGDEGAPDAWLVLDEALAPAMRDLRVGDEILVLTWLDRAARDVLVTRPRDDPSRPEVGVFSTRSPDRPNPVGLHRVRVLAIRGTRVKVADLEALDGTPVVDIKPILGPVSER
jgi:tRNA-Thr(GGU) m(6)t(6)A37 methyltransferase TsaA